MMPIRLSPVLALGALLACDAGTPSTCAGPRSDVAFIDAMVPHHQMAIEMADEVLARGESPPIEAIAQTIKDAQTAEILQMKAIRAALTGSEAVPAEPHDPVMMADLEKLMALSGAALDREFLVVMIPHHAGAITMAHESLPYLKRAELRTMADAIILDQAREVGQFAAMLTE